MKKLSNFFKPISVGITIFIAILLNQIPSFAQLNIGNLKSELEQVPTKAGELVNPIVNIVLFILGLGVIASLVIAYINKRKDNNANSNDKIIDALWTALVVILGIYAVKFLLIGG